MPYLADLGIGVNVVVNGSLATEYADDEPGDVDDEYAPEIPRSHHYIESIDGAAFSIMVKTTHESVDNWLAAPGERAFRFHLDLDGHNEVARGTATQYSLSSTIIGAKDFSGQYTSLRTFRFASISTVDDAVKEQLVQDIKKGQSLGTIRVRLYRSEYKIRKKPATHKAPPTTLAEGGEIFIAEKALKGRALSHGSSLSPPVLSSKGNTSVDYSKFDREPLAIVYFKYRSKEALRQELVLPRTPSPSVEAADADIDDLPDEEIRRLAREQLAQIRRGKKRSASVKSEAGYVAKSERPLKVLKKEGKTTIDLTDD